MNLKMIIKYQLKNYINLIFSLVICKANYQNKLNYQTIINGFAAYKVLNRILYKRNKTLDTKINQ